jgi:hypothetical protein
MYKYIIFAVVVTAFLVFGSIFWYNFEQNRQEIANTPLPDPAASQSQIQLNIPSDTLNSLDSELESVDLEGLDDELGGLETELQNL